MENQDTERSLVEAQTSKAALPESIRVEPSESTFKKAVKWLLLGATTSLILFMLGVFAFSLLKVSVHTYQDFDAFAELWMRVHLEHYAATVALPLCALFPLCLVLVLRYTAGPIEFEGMGLKFKGASGPLVMWLLCFLAMVSAVKLLW